MSRIILITGATGLVGSRLMESYQKEGMKVHYLTTRKSKILNTPLQKGFYWSVKDQYIDKKCFEGVDTLIHLAGANIAKRWTKSYQKEIIDSRVLSCELLIKTLQNTEHQIEKVICASAIGIYKSDDNITHKENSKSLGTDFLAHVTQLWEKASDNFNSISNKVYRIRIGIVLDKSQGALPKMTQPISMGLGAVVHTGKQWQSWIHIKDLVGVLRFISDTEKHAHKEDVFNAVAPVVVNNIDMSSAIAKIYNEKIRLSLPIWLLKIIFGKMYILLTNSTKVSCQKIENMGYDFLFRDIDMALSDLLKKD